MGIIYCARNKANGKIYIGKTSGSLKKRIAFHIRDSVKGKYYFHLAIKKYGSAAFVWTVIDRSEDPDELNTLEKVYIDMFSSCIRGIGYNSTHGGDGVTLAWDSLQKMSASKRGRPSLMKGKHFGQEAVKNMRASRVGIWDRNKHPRIGKTHTEESIRKMIATKLARQVLYSKVCSVCGSTFTAKVPFAKNCSKLCTLRDSRRRRKQEAQA